MLLYKVILSISLYAIVSATTDAIKPCPKGMKGIKQSVTVTPCPSDPCAFKRGTTGSIDIEFEAPADSKTLTAQAFVMIGKIPVPHPHFDRDICNGYGVHCPVTKGHRYHYKYPMKVLPDYPKIKTSFRISARDEHKNIVFCFLMPVEVVD